MKRAFVILLFLASSCSTPTKWTSLKPAKDTVVFHSGKIKITQVESRGHSSEKDILAIEVKITNITEKIINVKNNHIFIVSDTGEASSIMSDSEIKSYTSKIGALSTTIASGPFANSDYAKNHYYSEIKSKMLKSGVIPPNGYSKGTLWFLIPKSTTKSIRFEFYESLKTDEILSFKKGGARN